MIVRLVVELDVTAPVKDPVALAVRTATMQGMRVVEAGPAPPTRIARVYIDPDLLVQWRMSQ